MDRMIFVNLPVKDVAATRRFYSGLGFGIDETYSDEQCACIVVSSTIYVMALEHERFADFVSTPIADPTQVTQVLNCLSAASPQEVDELVAAALAHGGSVHRPAEDGGESPDGSAMYGAAVTDPDGHVWELLHMAEADG